VSAVLLSAEKAEKLLRLTHIRVEVVEVSQFRGPESCIGVCGVVSFVVLDIDKDIVFLCFFEQFLVVFEEFDGWLCYEDVNAALYGVESNWVVSGVRGKNGNCAAFRKCINRFFVCFRIALSFLGELFK